MTERRDQIQKLRHQRRVANENLDFQKAREIDNQIEELKKVTIKPDYSKVRQIKQRKQQIKQRCIDEATNFVENSAQMKEKYQILFDNLKAKQKEELNQLKEEKKVALQREMDRPIPLARERLMKAIIMGKTRQFDEAEKLKQQAIEITKNELPVRLEQCKRTYQYLTEKMKQRHAKEQLSLLEKFSNDFFQLEFQSNRRQSQLLASKQFKSMMEENERNIANREHRRRTRYKHR